MPVLISLRKPSGMSIDVNVADKVAVVTIDRPEKKNALTLEMREQLWTAFEGLAERDEVRAVILTGAGGAFCAGMDVGEMSGGVDYALLKMRRLHRIARSIANLKKPTIAAVDGVCVGAGWSFALACDFVVASEAASFAQSFRNIGLAPDAGAVWLLRRQLGTMRVKELVYSGRRLGAKEALDLGLVLELTGQENLMARARELAVSLSDAPTQALAMAKRQFDAASALSFDQFLELEFAMQPVMLETEDHREGVAALRERRSPDFQGC